MEGGIHEVSSHRPDIVARIRERHLVDIKSPINCVDSPEKATAHYEAAAKVTQRRLVELGMKTHLEEYRPASPGFEMGHLQRGLRVGLT
jgi:hypothetical protein